MNGRFDTGTETALKRFQIDNNLSQTEQVDIPTAKKIQDVTCNYSNTGAGNICLAHTFSRDLTIGSDGADSKALKDFLQDQGFLLPQYNTTGYFGIRTQGALAQFQSANNIFPPQGYFGEKTRSFLRSGCVNSLADISVDLIKATTYLGVGDDDNGTGSFTLTIDVTAIGQDIFLDGDSIKSSSIDTNTDGVAWNYSTATGNGTTLDEVFAPSKALGSRDREKLNDSSYFIKEGRSRSFSLEVKMHPVDSGTFAVSMIGLKYQPATVAPTDLGHTYTKTLDSNIFKTDTIFLDGKGTLPPVVSDPVATSTPGVAQGNYTNIALPVSSYKSSEIVTLANYSITAESGDYDVNLEKFNFTTNGTPLTNIELQVFKKSNYTSRLGKFTGDGRLFSDSVNNVTKIFTRGGRGFVIKDGETNYFKLTGNTTNKVTEPAFITVEHNRLGQQTLISDNSITKTDPNNPDKNQVEGQCTNLSGDLKRADRNSEDVRDLNNFLVSFGFLGSGSNRNIFTDETSQSVIRFKSAYDIYSGQTGSDAGYRVGPVTREKIKDISCNPTPTAAGKNPVLKITEDSNSGGDSQLFNLNTSGITSGPVVWKITASCPNGVDVVDTATSGGGTPCVSEDIVVTGSGEGNLVDFPVEITNENNASRGVTFTAKAYEQLSGSITGKLLGKAVRRIVVNPTDSLTVENPKYSITRDVSRSSTQSKDSYDINLTSGVLSNSIIEITAKCPSTIQFSGKGSGAEFCNADEPFSIIRNNTDSNISSFTVDNSSGNRNVIFNFKVFESLNAGMDKGRLLNNRNVTATIYRLQEVSVTAPTVSRNSSNNVASVLESIKNLQKALSGLFVE